MSNTTHIRTLEEQETLNLLQAKAQIKAFKEKIQNIDNEETMNSYMNNFQNEVDLLEQKLKSNADLIMKKESKYPKSDKLLTFLELPQLKVTTTSKFKNSKKPNYKPFRK